MNRLQTLITIALPVFLSGCGGGDQRSPASPVSVRTVAVSEQAVPAFVTAMGTAQAAQTATLSSKLLSRVTETPVREGDPIRKGDVLLRLDSQDLVARRRQVEAAVGETRAVLDNADLMLRRIQSLYDQKATPKRNLDDARTGQARAQAASQTSEAALKEIDATLAYGVLRAPFDGIVARKMVEPGDMAAPGAPLLIVENPAQIKVVARVGEGEFSAVRVGGAAFVEIDGPKRLPCTIERVVPSADPATRTFDVEAVLDNAEGNLRPGAFARLLIETGERRAVLIPRSALITQGQLEGVFVADGDVARLRWIRTGRDSGDRVEVLSGVSGGEQVIVSGLDRLKDGDRIKGI